MQIIVPQAVGLHLTRADEGIVALQSDIAAYLSRRPYRALVERDRAHSDRGRIVMRVKERPPDHILVRLSECVDNWLAALDMFASIISRRHSCHNIDSGFPIFLDADDFGCTNGGKRPAPGSGLYKIRGMKPSAQAIIERLQPYNNGHENDPLWVLHELVDATKVITNEPVLAIVEGSTYKVGDIVPEIIIDCVDFLVGPAPDKTAIGHVLVNKWHRDLAAATTFDLACALAFPDVTDGAGRPLPTNGRLINATTKLVRDAVWDTCWRLRFFTGRTGVTTIDSVPIAVDAQL
jgi:hypothetical protein